MPVQLLDSQFATLEPLHVDETAFVVDIDQEFETVVAKLAIIFEPSHNALGRGVPLRQLQAVKTNHFVKTGCLFGMTSDTVP